MFIFTMESNEEQEQEIISSARRTDVFRTLTTKTNVTLTGSAPSLPTLFTVIINS